MAAEKRNAGFLDCMLPDSKWGSAAVGTLTGALTGTILSWFSITVLGGYGFTLFLTVILVGTAFEGIFCVAMAAPIPLEAHTVGTGLRADRQCVFSTGAFREPILAWEEGKHFAFGVSEAPPLMKEWSPWGEIHVRHLEERDFRPQRADFYLTELPGGRTRLDGWTTYENRMWPGMYWRLWTDQIVHQIHGRVFRHVKKLAEEDARSGASGLRTRQGNASLEQECR